MSERIGMELVDLMMVDGCPAHVWTTPNGTEFDFFDGEGNFVDSTWRPEGANVEPLETEELWRLQWPM